MEYYKGLPIFEDLYSGNNITAEYNGKVIKGVFMGQYPIGTPVDQDIDSVSMLVELVPIMKTNEGEYLLLFDNIDTNLDTANEGTEIDVDEIKENLLNYVLEYEKEKAPKEILEKIQLLKEGEYELIIGNILSKRLVDKEILKLRLNSMIDTMSYDR